MVLSKLGLATTLMLMLPKVALASVLVCTPNNRIRLLGGIYDHRNCDDFQGGYCSPFSVDTSKANQTLPETYTFSAYQSDSGYQVLVKIVLNRQDGSFTMTEVNAPGANITMQIDVTVNGTCVVSNPKF